MADKDTDRLDEMRKRRRRAVECSSTLYDLAAEDIKFVVKPGAQWDAALRARRGDRPCYEFPKLQGHTRQVINEMRQTRPQGKIRGTEEGDRGLAELMQGLCRNIESVSNAEQAYDIAFETAVQGGMGVWRLRTDYLTQDDFDQDILIEPIRNPFSVRFDPAANEIDRRDGLFAFVDEFIPREEAESEYGDADWAGFDDNPDCNDWREAGKVRRSEYWYKKPLKRELWALSSGAVVYADEAGMTAEELAQIDIKIVKTRTVDTHKVYMQLTNGHEFLSEPYEFPSKFIPIVPVWGNIQNIDGEDYWQGMVRPSKDQQRLHNVHRTAMTEAVAKAPKAPYILKPKWIKGLENFWNRANADDFPWLPIRDDADGVPERSRQAEVPAALIQLAAMDNDDMKAATGQYDASLGARSNETSGIAINSRKMQGATATFNYIDNLSYAIKFTYEILIDMIPKVYDTPRVVRVLGDDGGEKWKQLYQEVQDPETGQMVVLNDISKGKYDVTVTVGPSYATQRMEAVEAFSQLAGQIGSSFPAIGPLLAFQVVKNLDLPGSEEVQTALHKALVAQGLMPPKEGEQPPAPPPPDPRMEAQVKKIMADAERAAADADKTRAETQAVIPQADADIQKTIAEAVQTQLENMLSSGQMAMLAQHYIGQPGYGPPQQLPPQMPPPQPPQGGFFMPQDQQFTG